MKCLKFFLCLFFAALGAVSLGGCASYRSVHIDAVDGGGGVNGTIVEPRFKQISYRVDRDKTIYIVLTNQGVDPTTGTQVDQMIIVRMFWQAVGGHTTMNNTALNATFRYIIMTPKAAAMYEGAGFVRIYGNAGSKNLKMRIMDGDLRLAETTAAFNDNLGRSRISGNFTAKLSEVQTFDLTEQAHREFFARSLALGGSKVLPNETMGPATQPAATEPAAVQPASP